MRRPAVHVLVFPFPAQGHVTSMLMLAEVLSNGGLHVTFLNTDYNHSRLTRFSGSYRRLAGLPGFRFRSIPDGLPDQNPRPSSRLLELEESMRTRSTPFFQKILTGSQDGSPPVTCVIVDGLMTFFVDVAQDHGIPAIVFWTSSSSSFWAYLSVPNLIDAGELPFPDADLDVRIRSVPGMEGFLRRRDLPSFCRHAREANDRALQFRHRNTANTSRARGLILNTVEFLEGPIVERIRSYCPATYAFGPLHSLIHTRGGDLGNTNSVSASLWEEDFSCMAWLNSHAARSVVYVSFGSLAEVSWEVMVEFWHGLVNSGYPFLWVVRPDLVREASEESPITFPPADVEEEMEKKGRIVGWAPQGEVLVHPAVGCFLTHSGWNSTLEGIMAGVPMICWPFSTDQQINSRYVSEVWRVGVDMKDMHGRDVVERMVKEVMEGDKAEVLRESVTKMAEMAPRIVEDGGSSYLVIQRLIQDITCLSEEVSDPICTQVGTS